MKKRSNQLSLGQAIKQMISDLGMEEKILTAQAEELFVEMMGNYIMKYVESFYMKQQVLYVKITSPELKNELQYGKSKIISHINEQIGKEFVLDVKFI